MTYLIITKIVLYKEVLGLKTVLNSDIDWSQRYLLEDYKKGEMFPAVSDTMFDAMLNNSKRKKYVAYLISTFLEEHLSDAITEANFGKNKLETILKGMEFQKDKLDRENKFISKKTVDLVCKLKGEIWNIEMNNNPDVPSLERNVYYASSLYASLMKVGTKDSYVKTIQININNFNFKGNKKTIDVFYLRDDLGNILTDKVVIVYVSLPLIRKKFYNGEELTAFELLMLVLNEKDSELLDKLMKDDKIMKEYRSEALEASMDSDIIGLYDKELEDARLERIREQNAKIKLEKSCAKAKNQGEVSKAKEIAINLIKNNVALDVIVNSTGLDLETIKKLQDETLL